MPVERKTTPWFNAGKKVNRPVHEGRYEVQLTFSKDQRIRRRYWNGKVFSAPVRVGESAAEMKRCKAIACPHAMCKIRWRGLVERVTK